MIEKYGFVYVWFDKKKKMYYIGSHWGTVDDGYICSSTRMRNVYKRRSEDFKRRILSIVVSNRKQLLLEEYKWLSMIKDEELGKRYYNHKKHHPGHWSTLPENYEKIFNEEYRKKQSENTKGQKNPFYGKKHSEKTKAILKEKRKYQIDSLETRKKKSIASRRRINKPMNKETKLIISNKIKELWKIPEYREKMLKARKK